MMDIEWMTIVFHVLFLAIGLALGVALGYQAGKTQGRMDVWWMLRDRRIVACDEGEDPRKEGFGG